MILGSYCFLCFPCIFHQQCLPYWDALTFFFFSVFRSEPMMPLLDTNSSPPLPQRLLSCEDWPMCLKHSPGCLQPQLLPRFVRNISFSNPISSSLWGHARPLHNAQFNLSWSIQHTHVGPIWVAPGLIYGAHLQCTENCGRGRGQEQSVV